MGKEHERRHCKWCKQNGGSFWSHNTGHCTRSKADLASVSKGWWEYKEHISNVARSTKIVLEKDKIEITHRKTAAGLKISNRELDYMPKEKNGMEELCPEEEIRQCQD